MSRRILLTFVALFAVSAVLSVAPTVYATTLPQDRITVSSNGLASLVGTVTNVSGTTLSVKSWDKVFTVVITSATRFSPTMLNSTLTPTQRLAAYKVGDSVTLSGIMSSSTYAITPTFVMNSTEMFFGSSVYQVRKFLSGNITEIGTGQVKIRDSITNKVFVAKTDSATILYDSLGRKVSDFSGWKVDDSAYAYMVLSGGDTGIASYIKNRTYSAPAPDNGVCGTANGTTVTTAPSSNLCSVGSPTAVSGTGPWSWQCQSNNGGRASYCYAYKQSTAAPSATLYASPTSITSGQTSKLTWTSSGATSCTLSPYTGTISTNGSVTVSPTVTTTYTLKCLNSAGTSVTKTATVYVGTVPAPTASLGASPSSITSGQTSTLTWVTSGATSCTLSPYTGTISTNGSVTVSPTVNTTYTLKCVNSAGTSVTKTATVSVGTVSTAVNGVCGSANGVTTPWAPETGLCSKGTATTVTLSGDNWVWKCNGISGGTTASCSAPTNIPSNPVGP